MPTYYARKTGNVNATDVWATTPTGTASDLFPSFTNQDVLVANSFTVTVNVSATVLEVRNDTTGGATAGGQFSISNGVTLTASIFAGNTATACVNVPAGSAATTVGNITGGGGSGSVGLNFGGASLTHTGNITGGTGSGAIGLSVQSAGPVSITGQISGGASGNGIQMGATNSSVTITGTVTGAGGNGVNNQGTGSFTIFGVCVGGPAAGANNTTSGSITATRAKGGPLLGSAVGISASTTGVTSVEEIEFGDLGVPPTSGPIRLVDKTSNVAVMYRFGTTKKTLTDPNATGLMPAASNVRSGVVYNGGNSTGTCAVPAASSVVSGALVDATAGTAALTPASLWDYLTSAATTSGSMGERLSNCATVASVGQSLANALTP